MTDYGYVKMSDLRYDLEQIDAFNSLDISAMSDDMVLLIHHQMTNAGHENAPAWYKSDVELWLNLERNVAIDNQAKQEQLQAEINELKARLGDLADDSHYDDMLDSMDYRA